MKAWVEPKNREERWFVRPVLEWLIWSCVKGRSEETSSTETEMRVVTLPSQNFKYWQKLRFEGTIGNWTEAQRVTAPQINSGSAVEAVASMSMSVSQTNFFV